MISNEHTPHPQGYGLVKIHCQRTASRIRDCGEVWSLVSLLDQDGGGGQNSRRVAAVRPGWLFDQAQFIAWREASKRRATSWRPSTGEAKGIGPAPNVRGASTAAASRPPIAQLLSAVLGNGSKNSTRSPTATSRGAPGKKRPKGSSANTSPRLSVVRPFGTA
jgi:hypothetical protein